MTASNEPNAVEPDEMTSPVDAEPRSPDLQSKSEPRDPGDSTQNRSESGLEASGTDEISGSLESQFVKSTIIAATTAAVIIKQSLGDRKDTDKRESDGNRLASIRFRRVMALAATVVIPVVGLGLTHVRADTEIKLAERRARAELAVAKTQHRATEARLKQEQEHKVLFFFFEKAVDPSSTPELRIRVLNYLKDDSNPRLKQWAAEELKSAERDVQEIRDLKDKLRAEQEKVLSSEEEREASRRKIARLTRDLHSKESSAMPISKAEPVTSAPLAVGHRCASEAFVEFGDGKQDYLCKEPSVSAYIDRGSGRLTWSIMIGPKRSTCLCEPQV